MGPGTAAAFTCPSGKGATDFMRGLRYLHEDPAHYKLSDQWLRKAAEQRCGEQCSTAALLLADAYSGGMGVPRNDRLALKWYKVAAKLALNPPAEVSIGDTYAGGWGNVPRNDKLAAKWYLRAFKQGSSLPDSELSKFYAEGLGGLAKNPVLACALHIAVVIGGFGEGGPPPESTQQRCASIDSHFTPEQLQRAKMLGHQLFQSHG